MVIPLIVPEENEEVPTSESVSVGKGAGTSGAVVEVGGLPLMQVVLLEALVPL